MTIRRAHGLETEYGLRVQVSGDFGWRGLPADEAARHLFGPILQEYQSTNVFLRNGGRLYLDVGAHPEYASAECATLADLVRQDAAGDAILDRLADRALELMAAEGVTARVSLFKNNLDSHGNSYGSHENYQVSRDIDLDVLGAALSGFLVTRQLVAGAGRWQPDPSLPGGGRFLLSQRAGHMWSALSSNTTRSRPLVNTRDEPHDDPQRFRRLHVIMADSTLCPQALLVRFGATDLVLEAVAAGVRFDDLAALDPATAIRDAATDLRGRAVLATGSGPRTALEVQRGYWERTRPFAGGEHAGVHDQWGRTLDLVESGDLDALGHLVDWAAKYRLIAATQRRHPGDPGRPAAVDLAYHDIRSGQGLFEVLVRDGRIAGMPDPASVREAIRTPPATRARVRSEFLTAAQRYERSHTVGWDRWTVHDLAQAWCCQPDPLESANPCVTELVERMAREPRSTQPGGQSVGLPPVL